MRVTILSEDFPPTLGGVSQWAKGVAQGLHDQGCRVNVYCRANESLPPMSGWDFSVESLDRSNWKHRRTWYWREVVARQIRRGDIPDLLIATKWNASRGVTALAAKHGFRLFTVAHGLDVTRRMGCLKRFWLRQTLSRSDLVISVSRFTAQFMLSRLHVDPHKLQVVPNGVNPAEFTAEVDTSSLRRALNLGDAPVILSLCRILPRKGHDMIIRALPSIARKVPTARYVIAGTGTDDEIRRLRNLAASVKMSDRVIFAGRISREDLVPMYALCSVYAMPSRFNDSTGDSEGFGITFLEANACGKPVIGGRSGGVVDAVEDGVSGYLVDPLSPRDIAEKIVFLLTHPDQAAAMGRRGRARIEQRFNWAEISRVILSLAEADRASVRQA